MKRRQKPFKPFKCEDCETQKGKQKECIGCWMLAGSETMTEEKRPELKSIILVYADGSTVELTEEKFFEMSKCHALLFCSSAFAWGLLQAFGRHARKLKR